MVTATLPSVEARRLRTEFEDGISTLSRRMPGVIPADQQASFRSGPAVRDVPVPALERTLNRIWRVDAQLQVKGFDEGWRLEHPAVALIKTTAGDRVLKVEKPPTGQSGIVNELMAPSLYAELGLRAFRLGGDGLRKRR
ncbi:MAG: hypothetical protein PHG85_00710 [Candidatus Altiarchaeota archaeon]|nr:hypothetical protein [Candidatus Altiarchaeota archaeon]